MLAFKNKEMKQFMDEVRLKTDIERKDKIRCLVSALIKRMK